jgi:hypothetical protein
MSSLSKRRQLLPRKRLRIKCIDAEQAMLLGVPLNLDAP